MTIDTTPPNAPAILGTPPPSHLAMAIFAVVVFWPLGLPAVINAAKVDRMVFMGDVAGAQHTSAQAKMWSTWAFGVAIGFFVLYLVMMGLMFAGLAAGIANSPGLR
jgi:hypothetical protein